MKLLLDENIAQSVSRGLRDSGFSVLHVLDVGLWSADDDEVLAYARKRRMVVVTHDKDFGNLIRYPLESHHGVLLLILRLHSQDPRNVLEYLLSFLRRGRNLKGRLVILREEGFRIV